METAAKPTRASIIHGDSGKSLEELLRVCKPLFVKMTRLPMFATGKHATSESATQIKRKPRISKTWCLWKRGYTHPDRRRRIQSAKRRKMAQLEMLKGKPIDPQRISAGQILNSNDLVEGSSVEKHPAGESGDSTTTLNETRTETHASEQPSHTAETPAITESNNELPNPSDATVEEPETNVADPPSDLIGICLRRSIVRDTAKRKRPLDSIEVEQEESNETSQSLKKLKPLHNGVSPCDEKKSPPNTKEKKIARKRVKPAKMKKQNPKSVRRQTNKQREARIILSRLEDSPDPLVRQWNEKRRPELFGEAGTTASAARPIENLIEESFQPAATDESSGRVSLERKTSGLPTTNVADREVGIVCDTTPLANTSATTESTNLTPSDEGMKPSGLSMDSDDENDEEVMDFLHFSRKVIPLIDSSSSDTMSYYEESRKTPPTRKITRSRTVIGMNAEHSSDSEEMATIRSLSRNAETPSITRSSPERTRPETRMSRMLRLASVSAAEYMDSESSRDNQNETSKSPRSRSQGSRKTPSWRQSITRLSIDSEASISVIEPRLTGQKSSRLVIDDSSSDSTYKPGEALTDMLDDELPSPAPTQNQPPDASTEVTNLAGNPSIDEDSNEPEAITEVNCDSSPIDDSSDSLGQRTDALSARRKLTVPNAMVVLTRLDALDQISESSRYSESEMDLGTAENTEWPRDSSSATIAKPTSDDSPGVETISNNDETADPLDINTDDDDDDDGSPPSETITPFAAVFCRTFGKVRSVNEAAMRSSPRKLPRVDYFPDDEIDPRWSQDSVESDVELSLILEENERMHRDSVDRTSGIGDSSVDSLCTPSEGVLNEANGNGDDQCRVNNGDDPDEAHREDQRLACDTIAATHKCVSCNALFKSDKLLARHRESSAACGSDLRCVTCQTICETSSELAKHRADCDKKRSKKHAPVDEATSNEADTDSNHIAPENYSSVWLPSKTDRQKSRGRKKSSKKRRKGDRARGDNSVCNVCSKNFGTTQALSEHIYKHSPEELQEAFRVCKAKMMTNVSVKETTPVANGDGAMSGGELTGSEIVLEVPTGTEKKDFTQDSRGTGVINVACRDALAATVCPCHRQTQANTEDNDLQIEMVLFCQHCRVLFRRRECFEVHYRASSRCANNRNRGRWPRMFCASCQLTLNSWADMRHHLEVHASVNADGTVRFVCNICRVVFVGFGALFYYHWFSHLRDTMFVASRHTFPRISVQPIHGLAKLPIGASPEESYIWVAEHVCADCRKPFSTRRDLELHRETNSCVKNVKADNGKATSETNDSLWYCDVCEIVFDNRDRLNDHGTDRHGRHYTCVSTSPKQKTFMCTKCCAMRKRVRDIEEHWKSHPQHNHCQFEMLNDAVTAKPDDDRVDNNDDDVAVISPLVKANEVVGNSPSTKNSAANGPSSSDDPATITKNGTPSDVSQNNVEESEKSVGKTSAGPPIDIVFQVAATHPDSRSRTDCTINEKSSNAETRTDPTENTFESTILSQLLKATPSAGRSSDKQKMRIGALEDPFVNVVMSNSSNENLSASLVIDKSFDTTTSDVTKADSHKESYRILMMDSNPKSNSGPIKMVLGRKSATSSTDKLEQPETGELTKERVSSSNQSSQKRTTVTGSVDGRATETTSKKKNDDARRPEDNRTSISLPDSFNDKSTEPEIIDIIEEIEITETLNYASPDENSSSKVSPAKSRTEVSSYVRSKKSSVTKLPIGSSKVTPGKKSSQNSSSESEMTKTFNDSGKSDHLYSASLSCEDLQRSFEEARYEYQCLSKNSIVDDSAVSKKQGFLRVKNISELQAVRQHECRTCGATFKSNASLDEHKLLHVRSTIGNTPATNPKGITAALVLPEPSVRPKTPPVVPSKNVTRTLSQSYVTPAFTALVAPTSANTAGVVGSSEAWMCNANNQNSQISSSLMLNVANRLSAFVSKYNVNSDVAKSVTTSTAGIAQPRQTFVLQSQPLIGYLTIPDVGRQLPEARNPGQLGYHVLPAMVAPSPQSNRHHTGVASQQNSSSNNLPASGLAVVSPITAQPINGLDKFVCRICRTFRCDTIDALTEHVNKHVVGFNNTTVNRNATQTSIPTVIVPQSSTFATVNQVVTNTIADNTTIGNKPTSERLVVNSWILSNPPPLWTPSNFNQQSGSSVLPMTTQSILSSTVQNSNGKVTNTSASATIWTPRAYNQPLSSSVGTIMKQSLTSPSSQKSNNNNNNDNSVSKKPPGWPVSTLNNTGETIGSRIVYQCTICKTATYTDQTDLRRHILLVHDVENFSKYVVDNVPKNYYCDRCPNGTAPFDLQSKLRIHMDTDHPNSCPFCNRNFGSHIFLNDHMEHCRTSNSHANFDSNCR